jgi:hypothetical protein
MVTRFAASLPTDICPQPKEAQPLPHALTSDDEVVSTGVLTCVGEAAAAVLVRRGRVLGAGSGEWNDEEVGGGRYVDQVAWLLRTPPTKLLASPSELLVTQRALSVTQRALSHPASSQRHPASSQRHPASS